MPQTPFSRVVAMLEAAGYVIQRRRKCPDREEAYFYFFSRPGYPLIGFPVVRKQVAAKHVDRIRGILEGFEDEQDEH